MSYVRHPQVLWDDVDGQLVLCHTETAQYYELNPMGEKLWRACDGIDLEAMTRLLAETHPEVDLASLAGDVRSYVATLLEENLLCLREG
ncbi:Coenzyme PQQ synthesis protein D (PqqD) [Nonomuraea solani]|jgi:hypothetical protein|uniref:Coenzyme PQQ synthesis protein D (PqqD) n=1 Tax=Nonomuraea solani TaxID=1144553 RepID=A0A1H6EGV8_9ACTN|nr:PqqD family protein [Nonomuraea solani]SEG96045.1 Coenzyme PQQ synthesis protein D (PqqD) [Nonomuraea solani]